jgi:hypothetical protein
MSKSFSLLLWSTRLVSVRACIVSNRRKYFYEDGYHYDDVINVPAGPNYYALAEDWRGEHCPYPMLPKWAKRLFEWRVALARKLGQKLPVRGWTWHFHCPECDAISFYTYRRHRCGACGTYFDELLRPIDRFFYRSGSLGKSVYLGMGKWEYRVPELARVERKSAVEDWDPIEDIPF